MSCWAFDTQCPFCGLRGTAYAENLGGNTYYEPADCSDCGAFENRGSKTKHATEDRLLDAKELQSGWCRGEGATCKRPCNIWTAPVYIDIQYLFYQQYGGDDQGFCACPICVTGHVRAVLSGLPMTVLIPSSVKEATNG